MEGLMSSVLDKDVIINFGWYFVIVVLWTVMQMKSNKRRDIKDDEQTKIIQSFIKELTTIWVRIENAEKILQDVNKYNHLGKWWVERHIPRPDICAKCTEYKDCPHPIKIRNIDYSPEQDNSFINNWNNND